MKEKEILFLNENCKRTFSRIKEGTVDLILQDPPYGTTNYGWDGKLEGLKELWKEWKRIIKPKGAIIFFSMQPFATDLINSNREDFKYDLVWNKVASTGFLNANKMPLRTHELILVFYKENPVYNPQKYEGVMREVGAGNSQFSYSPYHDFKRVSRKDNLRFPSSIVTFSSANRKTKSIFPHPSKKPLELIRYLVKTYTKEGGLIFDGYAGSATTAIAAKAEGRKFIGAEIDEKFYRIGKERLEKMEDDPEYILNLY